MTSTITIISKQPKIITAEALAVVNLVGKCQVKQKVFKLRYENYQKAAFWNCRR